MKHIKHVKYIHPIDQCIKYVPNYSTFGRKTTLRINPRNIPDLHWQLENSLHTTNIGQTTLPISTPSVGVLITIHPTLQIVDIGDGCEAYSTSIYIPAKSELTATMQSFNRSQFFLDYNFQYTNVSKFVAWYKTNFTTLTKEEITSLKAKIMKLPSMPMDIFDKNLEMIDENYPFSLSPKLILALLIATGVCFVIFVILFIWYKRKTTLATT